MVYKKYVKRGGKVFGPYYCESYRDKSGKVRTRFISGPDDKKSSEIGKIPLLRRGISFLKKPKINLSFILVILGIILLLGVIFIGFGIFNPGFKISGFVISENGTSLELSEVETIVQNFNNSNSELIVKEPAGSGLFGIEKPISKNKNKRMDFQLKEGNVRLYFDLLNYSEFVENVAESSKILVQVNETIINETVINETIINESVGFNEQANESVNPTNVSEQPVTQEEINPNETNASNETALNPVTPITGNVISNFFGLIGRVIGVELNQTSSFENTEKVNFSVPSNQSFEGELGENKIWNETTQEETNQTSEADTRTREINSSEIRQSLDNLTKSEIQTISDDSVISAENFDIIINDSKINQSTPEYKWGYKVKLNDLKFMAKIEVTSNETISQYNDYSLKIGRRSLLSFEDLVKAGYRIRIESPSLEIPINVSVNLATITRNITIINETVEEKNLTEVNVTEINITETNFTIPVINVTNETIANITETNVTIVNQREEINQTEEINKTQETQPAEQIPAEETSATTETETTETQTTEKTSSETAVSEETGITGSIIKFFQITGKTIASSGKLVAGFAGRVIGIDENITEIPDIKYDNTITVYIERDMASSLSSDNENSIFASPSFEDLDGDGKISIGDIINLDPTLIIIPATDAEHLDENRSFISNIYDYIKTLDNNWSEVIPFGDFVRVTFSQALGRNNDITVFARSINNESSSIEVYRQNENEVIAKIENITSENWYKTYLTGLSENESYETFDLRIINAGNVLINNSVIIDGKEVPYDIFQKKKRIDELRRLLNQS